MKGYYVLPSLNEREPILFVGKNCKIRAIKKAIELYEKEHDENVGVMRFDDDNSDGYFAGEKLITTDKLYKELENEGS